MQTIITISDRLVQAATDSFTRYLYDKITWEERLIGITGAEGTGKTIHCICAKKK